MIPLVVPGVIGLTVAAPTLLAGGTTMAGLANVLRYLGMAKTAWDVIPEKHRETIIDAMFQAGFNKANEWSSATPKQTEFDFGDETDVQFSYSFSYGDDSE